MQTVLLSIQTLNSNCKQMTLYASEKNIKLLIRQQLKQTCSADHLIHTSLWDQTRHSAIVYSSNTKRKFTCLKFEATSVFHERQSHHKALLHECGDTDRKQDC
jgi:hypothetical protein